VAILTDGIRREFPEAVVQALGATARRPTIQTARSVFPFSPIDDDP
jgi:hypothetical protein